MQQQAEGIEDVAANHVGGHHRLPRGSFLLHQRDPEGGRLEHETVVAPVADRRDPASAEPAMNTPMNTRRIR